MVFLTAIEVNLGANDVLKAGADLTEAYDEELVVLYMMIKDYEEEERIRPTFTTTDTERDTANEIVGIVDIALENLDVENQIIGRLGEPMSETIDAARAENACYLVIGGRRRSPTGKALFGSITQPVLLNANIPVVTVLSE